MPMTSPVDFISGPRTVSTPGELDEGEHRLLHGDVRDLALLGEAELARASRPSITRVASLASGTPMALDTNGHGARGARVDLEHVDLLVLDRELDVHQADHAELPRERARLRLDALDLVVAERVGRQRAGGVAGVDAGLLDVLHDAAHHHALAVGDGVHVDLEGVLEELVDQDRDAPGSRAPPRVM